MTVYLLHLDTPIAHASHYLGHAEDLINRLLEHQETTWEPLDEPVITADGRKISGIKHGNGATLIAVANFKGIRWRLARTWDGADRAFERRLKNCHMGPDLCPECNPHAMNRMNMETQS